jgi:hypothetical protein
VGIYTLFREMDKEWLVSASISSPQECLFIKFRKLFITENICIHKNHISSHYFIIVYFKKYLGNEWTLY